MTEITPPSEQAAEILNFEEYAPKKETRRSRRLPGGVEDIVTEDGTAQRFAEIHRNRLRYCHSTGAWFVWDGVSWKVSKTGIAFQWARQLARELAQRQKEQVRYVTSKTSFAAGVERFSRSDPIFAVTIGVWDRDPFLLGTPEGTVDLKTGKLRPSDPEEGHPGVHILRGGRGADQLPAGRTGRVARQSLPGLPGSTLEPKVGR